MLHFLKMLLNVTESYRKSILFAHDQLLLNQMLDMLL